MTCAVFPMLRSELGLSYLSRSATNALSVHTIFFSEAYEEQELLNMCIIPVCISADVFALTSGILAQPVTSYCSDKLLEQQIWPIW